MAPVLNQLVRYAPVVAMLRDEPGTILEVGSGSTGIAHYLGRRTLGLEIRFHEPPGPGLVAVAGTATALPFADGSVEVVLIMDTMEHIPDDLRAAALLEAMRVARRTIIVGGPMGHRARSADEKLAGAYRKRGIPLPDWLQEHLVERAPDVEDIAEPMRLAGWEVGARGNENLHGHLALMRLEMHPFWYRVLGRIRRHAPRAAMMVARWLRVPPYYSSVVRARRSVG
jgi:hypothetical protein